MSKMTGSHFKLPKSVKYQLANFVNPDERNEYKKLMISAVVAEESSRKKTVFKDDDKE